jgi:hypothetical protein
MKKVIPMKSCGGLSEVYVHADRQMHIYGTAKETEQMLKKDFRPQPQNKTAMKKSSPYLYIF